MKENTKIYTYLLHQWQGKNGCDFKKKKNIKLYGVADDNICSRNCKKGYNDVKKNNPIVQRVDILALFQKWWTEKITYKQYNKHFI